MQPQVHLHSSRAAAATAAAAAVAISGRVAVCQAGSSTLFTHASRARACCCCCRRSVIVDHRLQEELARLVARPHHGPARHIPEPHLPLAKRTPVLKLFWRHELGDGQMRWRRLRLSQ